MTQGGCSSSTLDTRGSPLSWIRGSYSPKPHSPAAAALGLGGGRLPSAAPSRAARARLPWLAAPHPRCATLTCPTACRGVGLKGARLEKCDKCGPQGNACQPLARITTYRLAHSTDSACSGSHTTTWCSHDTSRAPAAAASTQTQVPATGVGPS